MPVSVQTNDDTLMSSSSSAAGGGGAAASGGGGTDSSYSMLFSPGVSSLASATPGGVSGVGGGAAHHDTTNNANNNNNSSSSNSMNLELEVQWDPSLVKSDLLQASAVLSHRCLKYASNWAATQMAGIPVGQAQPLGGGGGGGARQRGTNNNNILLEEFANMTEMDWYAKSLVDLGEYLHAAAILSTAGSNGNNINNVPQSQPPSSTTTKAEITQVGPPKPDLSSYGFYIRAYALYMAGERRKEEDYVELQSEAQRLKGGGSRNPYLQQLIQEMSQAYNENSLDVFGCYVYGIILKDASKESLTCPHPPHVILVECLIHFPYNWSAWLDLYDVVVDQPASSSSSSTTTALPSSRQQQQQQQQSMSLEQEIEQLLQPELATNYMYHFFCAHLMTQHHQAHEEALAILERLYEPLPDQPLFQSPQMQTQMAVIHYHLREFEQALQWFHSIDLHPSGRYSLDQKDVYSNILYVKEDRVALSHLAHEAVALDKYRPETCCIIGNYYSLKQQRHKAILYFQRALKLDRNYTSAWTLMGHEFVEMKQTEAAMEAYRRAVNVSPKDYRAWYGLGQTYELLNMHMYALFYYRKAAVLRPYDARMWTAVGQCLIPLHKIPEAMRAFEKAIAQQDHEGIATQKLANLYRNDNQMEQAAQCFLRHLELRYLVTNPDPFGGTDMMMDEQEQAHGGPTLDAIVQGVALGPIEAEALAFLAQYHKTNGEYDTAALMASRLVEYPGPEKEHGKAILRDIRSRERRQFPPRSTTTGATSMLDGDPTGGGGSVSGNTTGSGGGRGGGGGSAPPQSPFQFSP